MSALHELAKVDRKAALLYNREVRLLVKRGKIKSFGYPRMGNIADIVDSFDWYRSQQGWNYWADTFDKALATCGEI